MLLFFLVLWPAVFGQSFQGNLVAFLTPHYPQVSNFGEACVTPRGPSLGYAYQKIIS